MAASTAKSLVGSPCFEQWRDRWRYRELFCCCDGSHGEREALASPLGKQPYVKPWHSKHETLHRWHAHRPPRRAPANRRPPEVVAASSLPDQCRLPVVNRRDQLVVAVNRQGCGQSCGFLPRCLHDRSKRCCSWDNAHSTDANANDPTGKVVGRDLGRPVLLRVSDLEDALQHSCDDPC
jgi:hypothetical protein